MKNRTKLFYFLVFSLVFSGSVFHAFSAPPSSYYYSGQTLDPSCSPGDTNCSASILEIRDSGSNVTYNGKKLDFTGTGVTATESSGVVTVAIPALSDPEVGVSEVNGGSSGRVFFIGSDSTLASSSGMTYNDATDTLSITRINMPDTGSGDGVIYLNDERFIFGFPNSGSLPYLTFIGYQAGDTALSSGVNQTVGIGYQAGTSLTVSGTNTYIGYKAGTLNAAAAIGSTIIGANASTQNASQPYVTAIGRNALSIDSGAQRSVAIGSGVDENTTNADYDAVLGYNTFNARVNGTQNTALGALVAPTVTNTSSTNIIGYKAGNSISSSASTNHIIMGYQAGDNITTASKTIIIGYDIDGITINGGNYITIGNMIYGTSHTATATTISTGSIGIGDS
ncbi:hypothetical protein KC842_03215, partial [Candidatus Nomurabacteria bacterium]|nr:hypothetical protein [Candidatus Nomurabacteria bacterium]